MTISERVFEKIREIGINQKEFSERTGILQSTISEWKKKRTNPASDKIMIICQVLGVTPEWLLSGVENNRASKNGGQDWYVIDRQSEPGALLEQYNNLDSNFRARVIGYVQSLTDLTKEKEKNKKAVSKNVKAEAGK